ncbi:hypothetical protein NL64_06200 [Pseudomonas fluorescens]|uniref:phage adaptor protein n=1 Tax=Pseudomonas fluorescens TaxID=294 RepID=UPI00054B52F5|nr:DUF6682 family protein [Pseudomonas fluorescens]KII34852.1 hypothetical protein NL64_06200 [Pseudomonas fluorescens]
MTILASDIITRAQTIVQDTTGVRWPFSEMLQWLNDGQREVAIYKPSATAVNVALTLTQGTLQSIGAGGLALLRVMRNLKTPVTTPRVGTRAARVVDREVLDSQHPSWHDPSVFTYAKEVKHFCFDDVDPTNFYVFPGNDGTGAIEAVISRAPADVVAVGDPNVLTSYRQAISIPDIYSNVLLDYVLFRAYSKDADFAGNGERSSAHYTLFAGSLAAKAQNEAVVNPNVRAKA